MANSTNNVSTGKGKVSGYAYMAPAGTTLPTDATTALASDYQILGYISEDGITHSTTRDAAEIKDLNGDTVLSPQTGHSETFGATFIESLNTNVLKMVYGDDAVTVDQGAITIEADGAELPASVFVFELIERDKAKRIVVPNGKITEVGDVVYNANDVVGYEVTINALPDASECKHYEYIA